MCFSRSLQEKVMSMSIEPDFYFHFDKNIGSNALPRGPIPPSDKSRGVVFDKTAILSSERDLMAPKHCVLMKSPSIVVHRNSGFVQIGLNFFQILIRVHRVHGCEKHWLSVPFETSSSRNQSTLNDGVHVMSVPDVVDALGEVVR